jgi:tetratricopeptide (TPR) repeat protein
VIRQWNAAAAELMEIYPPATEPYYTDAMHFGLLAEAKGSYEDAVASYRLASRVAVFDRLVPDNARYQIDLGLARSFRQSGHPQEAVDLCNKWKTKWKKLVVRSGRARWETREDGEAELKGRWEFSCGNPETGFQLIEEATRKYPQYDAPYRALAQYDYSIREIEKARDAEATAAKLSEAWTKKAGEF